MARLVASSIWPGQHLRWSGSSCRVMGVPNAGCGRASRRSWRCQARRPPGARRAAAATACTLPATRAASTRRRAGDPPLGVGRAWQQPQRVEQRPATGPARPAPRRPFACDRRPLRPRLRRDPARAVSGPHGREHRPGRRPGAEGQDPSPAPPSCCSPPEPRPRRATANVQRLQGGTARCPTLMARVGRDGIVIRR